MTPVESTRAKKNHKILFKNSSTCRPTKSIMRESYPTIQSDGSTIRMITGSRKDKMIEDSQKLRLNTAT